jgi:hypothetical protein
MNDENKTVLVNKTPGKSVYLIPWIICGALVIALVVSAFGWYTKNKEASELVEKVSDLEMKLADEAVIRTPRVTYGEVISFSSSGAGFTDGETILAVDIVVTNVTANNAEFDAEDFRLKDSDKNTYELLRASSVGSQPRFVGGITGIPGGRSEIRSQELQPEESVKGTILFYVTRPLKEVSITHDGKSKQIRIEQVSNSPKL